MGQHLWLQNANNYIHTNKICKILKQDKSFQKFHDQMTLS